MKGYPQHCGKDAAGMHLEGTGFAETRTELLPVFGVAPTLVSLRQHIDDTTLAGGLGFSFCCFVSLLGVLRFSLFIHNISPHANVEP